MCGRFTQAFTWSEVVGRLRGLMELADESPGLDVRYNVRPGEPRGALLLRTRDGAVHPDRLKWGFRVGAKKPFAPINAKSETLFEKWPWKSSALHRRCLIPTDGFFEPKGSKTQTQRPQFFFQFPDSRPFFVAGVWTGKVQGADLDSFAIITTDPNDQVAPIHDRMPAIVEPQAYGLWLSDTTDAAALQAVLCSWSSEPLECWEVDRRRLNEADDERCIEPV